MTDKSYVYGHFNGDRFHADDSTGPGDMKTHYDPRIEVSAPGGSAVQVGVVPPHEAQAHTAGQWFPEEGQFLTLSRDGVNRLIVALREARELAYGKDE